LPRNTVNSADIRDARNELGDRLRELRRAAGLTVRQLAASLSWPPSKISKLENGQQTPSDADVRAWTAAVGAEREADSILTELHTLSTRYADLQRLLRGGQVQVQRAAGRRESRTAVFRMFESTFVPGLLQTADYARHRLAQSARVFGRRVPIEDAVAERMKRQEILYDRTRAFRVVITEPVLQYALSPPDVMLGQLDRIMSLATLPNVRLGIIPLDAEYVIAPAHGFWLYDDRLVVVETFAAELNLTQPGEVELYTKIFETLALDAVYDRRARALIAKAAEVVEARFGSKPERPSEKP
jgi:transcriptional regulator with XRE-family HTH domain